MLWAKSIHTSTVVAGLTIYVPSLWKDKNVSKKIRPFATPQPWLPSYLANANPNSGNVWKRCLQPRTLTCHLAFLRGPWLTWRDLNTLVFYHVLSHVNVSFKSLRGRNRSAWNGPFSHTNVWRKNTTQPTKSGLLHLFWTILTPTIGSQALNISIFW